MTLPVTSQNFNLYLGVASEDERSSVKTEIENRRKVKTLPSNHCQLMDLNYSISILFLLLASWAGGDPIPEAVPEADPASMAQADAQARWLTSRPGYQQDVCGLTNACCNVANANCCQGGRQCYTVWDRKCDSQSRPVCGVKRIRDCHNIQKKTCRSEKVYETREFKSSKCQKNPVKKCMTHTTKVCKTQTRQEKETISWIDQKLSQSGFRDETHCLNVTKSDCSPRVVQTSVPRQVVKQRPVTTTQKRCRMVPDRTPDQEVEVPVTRVTYTTMCYNIPRRVCDQVPCATTGYCAEGTSVCSNNEMTTASICPQPQSATGVSSRPAIGAPCQEVQQPVCYNTPVCQMPAQQCCRVTNQQVCRQVPQRVVEQVKQVIPGRVTYRQECDDLPMTRYESYTETINEIVNKTVQDCQMIVDQDCHTYKVPQYEVNEIPRSKDVFLPVMSCELEEKVEQHCHTFYDSSCSEEPVKKKYEVTKTVCDQVVNEQQCIYLPVTDCREGDAVCRMVPRQVCQDTCSQAPLCNVCEEFRNGPGFGTCPTSTCGTFYSNDPFPFGGEGYYPGGTGGEGYYPGGTGGEGYYPGGSGGEGYYPGDRAPWDDALTPPNDGRSPWDDALTPPNDGRSPWDDALTPPNDGRYPWDDALRPPRDRNFNTAPAMPSALAGSEGPEASVSALADSTKTSEIDN